MSDIKIIIDDSRNSKYIRDIIRNDLRISSGLLSKLKHSGGIKLNGNTVTVANKVCTGDTLTIEFPNETSSSIVPTNIPLDIVYEDEYILAVNKPKDMPTHPSIGNRNNTLGNACMYYFKDSNFVFRPLTRLDRDTTGIVLIAKDARTSAILSEQIQRGEIKKTYYTITCGIPSPAEGKIEQPIGRTNDSIIKREVRPDGQNAITNYRILATKDNLALLEIDLVTGRTHQIRVHLSHIGCPLLFDYLYGEEVPGETLYLHCGKIEFIHPINKSNLIIKAKPRFPIFNEYLGIE